MIRKVVFLLILLAHPVAVYLRGYFLSVEFTLYPYLTAHGFLPYQNLLDQHFPTLFFGPFSLPAFLTVNPWPLLALFLGVLVLTDLLLWASLTRSKVRQPLIWLLFYLTSSLYFSGSTLWIETFVNLLLSVWLFLSHSSRPSARIISGLLLSQVLLLRPTIAPALLFLFLGFGVPFSPLLLGGLLTGFLIPALYLVRYNLFGEFYRLAIVFNTQVYPAAARLLPAKRQILLLVLWLFPVGLKLLKNKKFFLLLSLISFFVLIVPRFGYEHLQPLFLCVTLVWAINSTTPPKIIYLMIVILFVLNLVSSIRHPYGNYFLTPEVKSISEVVRRLPGQEIYLLGASDLIYPLSGKLPPQKTYLPSLPWYFTQSDFTGRVIRSLSGGAPVLVDYTASVDGYNTVESSGPIFEYIKINFTSEPPIGNYQLFLPQ